MLTFISDKEVFLKLFFLGICLTVENSQLNGLLAERDTKFSVDKFGIYVAENENVYEVRKGCFSSERREGGKMYG